MNFLFAVLIGAVIGAVGGYLLRGKHPNALWLSPALAVVGSVLASILASAFGKSGYGMKEFGLQVVLAIVGVGVVYFLGSRSQAPTSTA